MFANKVPSLQSSSHPWISTATVLLVSLFIADALRAQTQGEITGEVVDETESKIVGAAVTVTNEQTNVSRAAVTNTAGVYSVPALMPGTYTVKTEVKGFQSEARTGIELQVQQVARVDFRMRVGQVSEVIRVSGAATMLATEDVTIGTVIDNKRIIELPLNARNYLQLVSLSPNVAFGFPPLIQSVSRQGGDRPQWSISVAGQRSEFNYYTLDGVSNTNVNFNTYVFAPSIDAVQEFKVQTGVYPAEFGRETSQVNVSTKAGTNTYHGTMFEFLRNAKVDAIPYAFTAARPAQTPYIRNQFGFTLAGPVYIPKVFNGTNRLFFMTNYEALRSRQTLLRVADLPTQQLRSGDFSGLSQIVYDPSTRTVQPNGKVTALPFPGNMIPSSRLNAKSQKLLQFLPLPNVATSGFSSDYQASVSSKNDNYQLTQRVDFAEGASSNWFGRISWGNETQVNPSTFPLSGQKIDVKTRQLVVNNVRIFSPSVVNEFRFGYNGFHNLNTAFLANTRDVVSEIGGFAGVPTATPDAWGIPSAGINGFSGIGDDANGPFIDHDHTFQWIDNVSMIRGTHSIRFGAEIRRDRFNEIGNQFSRGSFSFTGVATSNPSVSGSLGVSVADYLLGYMYESQVALGLANAQLRATSQAYYVDDSWKARPNLTISLGLRYELTPPYVNKNSNMINVYLPSLTDPSRPPVLVRPGTGNFYQDIPFVFGTGILTARDGRMGNALVRTDYHNFAPRLGLAYQLTPKWTIRSAFGVFFAQDIGNYRFDMARNDAGRRDVLTDQIFPNLTWDNPFGQAGSSTTIVNNPLVLANDYNGRTPYVFQYLLNVQRQLSEHTIVEFGYVGSVGRKLEAWSMANYPVDPGPGSVQSRRPFPALGVIQLAGHRTNSSYNGGSVKLERRFSDGLTYIASYTFSRSIDDGSSIRAHINDTDFPQNPYDLTDRHGLSAFQQKHYFVTSLLWEVPVGRGKRLNLGGIGNAVLGNWQLGTIFTARSGVPFTVTLGSDAPNTGQAGYVFPNATGITPVPPGGRSPQSYINRAAFAVPPQYTFGNSGRNNVIGPGGVIWDGSAMKSFRLPIEGHSLEFRFEAFNVPNRPNFGIPTDVMTSVSFGKITSLSTPMRQLQFSLKYAF